MLIPLEDMLTDPYEADRAKVEAGAQRIIEEQAAAQEPRDAHNPSGPSPASEMNRS